MKKIVAIVLFAAVLASCGGLKTVTQSHVTPDKRQPVDTVKGQLTLHPLVVDIVTKEETLKCLLVSSARAIFITSDNEVYQKISDHLPLEMEPDRVAILEGTLINPFTVFTPEEFDEANKKFAKLGVELNRYRIVRLFNAGITTFTQLNAMNVNTRQQTNKTPPNKNSSQGNDSRRRMADN